MTRSQSQCDALILRQSPAQWGMGREHMHLGNAGPPAPPCGNNTEGSINAMVGVLGLIPDILSALERIATAMEEFAAESHRIADHVAPAASSIVGTPYLAKQLDCSTVWAAEMARDGEIPKCCILPGTGNGKPWKFYRSRVEEWINKR